MGQWDNGTMGQWGVGYESLKYYTFVTFRFDCNFRHLRHDRYDRHDRHDPYPHNRIPGFSEINYIFIISYQPYRNQNET
jgi:hypothetical protein